jgi:hypothetical protein
MRAVWCRLAPGIRPACPRPPVYEPLPVGDPIQRCPDISQASAPLDWKLHRTALGRAGDNRLFGGVLSSLREPPAEEAVVAN